MNAPKKLTWFIALVLAAVGILGHLVIIPVAFIKNYDFWFVVAGYALLFLGTIFKGL